MKGNIHSIETFGTVDGPGIRYVIFLQGCPLRCAYCHNPDTWEMGVGEEKTTDELVEDILKYTRYIDGITVSGGEPLLQIDFLIELFQKVKEHGLTTCIDTAGSVFDKNNIKLTEKIDKLLTLCDLVMLDIKHINSEEHKKLTGITNTNILDFARFVDSRKVNMWLRYVLVPTINDSDDIVHSWKIFADTLKSVSKVEVLPYHKLGIDKYKKLGIDYKLENIPEPTKELIDKVRKELEAFFEKLSVKWEKN